MLCRRCEQSRKLHGTEHARELHSLPGWDRLKAILCTGCGDLLPRQDGTERLLDNVSRLARLGLTAGTEPLLRP